MNTIVRGWHVQNEFVLGRRKSSATVSDSYGYTRPRVAAGPPSVSAPPEAVKDAHPPARTSVPMPAVNAAVSAWYVRDEIGLNSRKTSATSSDKFGYTRLHVTAPPLLPAAAPSNKSGAESDSDDSQVFESPALAPIPAPSKVVQWSLSDA